MAFSRRRAAEDKNTKHLRELASLPANKQCFDCLQRGPTYINVTIGSFVCTTCSGILRGLTPPHRVKSISMTTFTPEEIEYLKSKGNEYCKYVWLGKFDISSNSIESEVSDDQRKRDFMIQKYEKKRWYVEPDVAVKKMQSDASLRPKQVAPQYQNLNSRSNIPETQPLSRLLGKSPTPLVVQNNQNTETWPHPVSSASASTISTKTAAQNNGSRSIDWLSEFAGTTTKTNPPIPLSNSSTANGDFANFENAFSSNNSIEKSAPPPTQPAHLPSSTSLDAYPMQSRKNQPITGFGAPTSNAQILPLSTSQPLVGLGEPPTKPQVPPLLTQTQQSSNADRYAALADLDSLFHQPTTAKAPSWTVETSSSGSLHEVSAPSTKSSAPSNPFAAATELWNQPQPAKSTFQSANPFQTEGLYNESSTSNNPAFAPFQIPMVGNSPSDDSVRNQFNANFPAFQEMCANPAFPVQQTLTSPTNGYGTSLHQNGGGLVSPTAGTWNMPTNLPMWSSSQTGLGGLFGNDNKPSEPAQHADWIQNPVNPFAVPSSSSGFSVAPKNNCNPFL
ncbi:hypothetical protein JTE90_000991 [Oedothorax gibbosus]|uniref:Arf-GAP domain-containing protein n=1 Tax=Oedothorax gibbosus TaxID=931172 RepID=A0AAV6VDM2_9ARAC|nr:hypothetical protein JTE90_000991 [Oedothorax gibbosus]